MDKNQASATALAQPLPFKAYPKNEQVSEDFISLAKAITRRPRLVHHMDLNYEHITYHCEPIESQNLHTPLRRLKLIGSLLISLYEADLENHMILQNISIKLKLLPFLQNFHLEFYFSNWVSIEGVISLANALRQMKFLEKLALIVQSCEWVNDESLHLIFRSLKKNKKLQSLKLDLSNCAKITEKSFKDLASILKHSLKPLKELSLELVGLNFKGNSMEFLANGLISLKCLQRLHVNFSSLQAQEGIVFPLFLSSIKQLKSLQILNLDFSSSSLPMMAFSSLGISFSYLTQLHTLSLSFWWSSTITALEMEALVQCLQPLAASLKNLTLMFTYSQSVNDLALEKLSAGLKTLTNLSEIVLHCDHCPYVGDAGVASIADGLAALPNLHTVVLGFRRCRPVKDIYYESLKTSKTIKHLTFGYEKCKE